jgi:hypothetical protein
MTPDDSDAHEQLDLIEELTRSAGYRLVAKRIVSVVEQKVDALESERMVTRPDEANYTRGIIAGMKLCLRIPDMMQSEIEEDLRTQTKKAVR